MMYIQRLAVPSPLFYIVVRAAQGAKHDPNMQGDRKAFQQRLRDLATFAIAAMEK
jgi:hypothetical protein